MTTPDTGYDPADHTVDEVNAYLADQGVDERSRVLDKERTGKARTGVLEGPHRLNPTGEPVDASDGPVTGVLVTDDGGRPVVRDDGTPVVSTDPDAAAPAATDPEQ